MMESRSIIEFRIVYSNQKLKKRRPISEFLYINSLLARQGISHVRMITFYMNDGHHYPYGIHPIMLKQYDNKLYVFFYHYYDTRNQVIGLSMEQRLQDYYTLLHFLDYPSGVLLPLLQPPCILV
jgi:hypothetical protein